MSERVPRRRAIATLGGTALAAGAALAAPPATRAWAGVSTAASWKGSLQDCYLLLTKMRAYQSA